MRIHGIRVVVCKNRTLYRFHEVVIACDDVEHLGVFIELRASSEKALFDVITLLNLENEILVKESYFDLMCDKKLPEWFQMVLRFHEKIGEFVFGITSGILTTSGLLVGVNSATESRIAVIATIATIAIADSFSDAFGMYLSKVSERGICKGVALRYACGTLVGKFIFPITFIIPILLCQLGVGVAIDLLWGVFGLTLLSIEQAIVVRESAWSAIVRNVGLAVIIVTMSLFVGRFIEYFVGNAH